MIGSTTHLIVETSVHENLHLQVLRWKNMVKAVDVPSYETKSPHEGQIMKYTITFVQTCARII